MKIPFNTIFQKSSGGYSSKRVCGVIGWLVTMFCLIWCVVHGTDAPSFTTELVAGCVTLLGVDSVTDAVGNLRKK